MGPNFVDIDLFRDNNGFLKKNGVHAHILIFIKFCWFGFYFQIKF